MGLKVAVQMDHLHSIDIAGDSSFALMLEAEARGHTLFCYHVDQLALDGANLFARGSAVTVRDVKGDHFSAGEPFRCDLSSQDVILMRQDPPFDMGYITATHLLEQIHPKTLVVNDPKSVRNAPEKLFVLNYRQFMPDTLITRDMNEIAAFRRTHGDIILKPLFGNGGIGVVRLTADDQNFASILELFMANFEREPFMAQKYVPAVRQGDKRIILVDGKAVGAINRVPAADDHRSNMHVGGRAEPVELTKRDHDICEAMGEDLRRQGLIFVGIDVIGDFLTEINVTSPTGIRQVKRFGGADIASLIWDAIEGRISG